MKGVDSMKEKEITGSNFKEEVLECTIPVLIDFWAPWCAPCRMIAPIITDIANEMDKKIKVGKVNIDEQESLAREFGVMSIPTLMLFKNGEIADTIVGLRSKQDILNLLK